MNGSNTKTDLFAALQELSERYPHWRVGQLLANVAGWADAEVWDAGDEELLGAALAHLQTSPVRPAAPSALPSPTPVLEPIH